MRNCIAISYLSLFISFQAVAGGIDAGTGFVAPKQVACVGAAQDNSVVILSYTKDDNNLFVPGALPKWPSSYSSTTHLRNVILQMSSPVVASPGYYLPVNVILLKSAAAKASVFVHSYQNTFYGAQLTIETALVSIFLYRGQVDGLFATVYRRKSSNEREYYAYLNCK